MQAVATAIGGIPIVIEGEGADTLLFLHGWPDTLRLWDTTVAALKGRYRCVRFTLPGFDPDLPARGTSLDQMTALLARIVDGVSPGTGVTLVLHDWGCAFGYEFAAQHPQRVARIVAVDVGDHNSGSLRRWLTVKARMQVFGYQAWLAIAWILRGEFGNRMTRGMARALRCSTDPAHITWQMNYPYAMQWFGSFGGLRHAHRVDPHCPLLYIYGQRKPFMFHSPQWLARLNTTPGCAVQAFTTGHWVMVQQPDAFNACIRDWLAANPVPTYAPC
ncbi:MAG: alpha/beta hydrolase [Rhodoferax sp.]|nr:alpha/beta hydrolase [Rhodoferax sp.]